jgi:hypothetical protein
MFAVRSDRDALYVVKAVVVFCAVCRADRATIHHLVHECEFAVGAACVRLDRAVVDSAVAEGDEQTRAIRRERSAGEAARPTDRAQRSPGPTREGHPAAVVAAGVHIQAVAADRDWLGAGDRQAFSEGRASAGHRRAVAGIGRRKLNRHTRGRWSRLGAVGEARGRKRQCHGRGNPSARPSRWHCHAGEPIDCRGLPRECRTHVVTNHPWTQRPRDDMVEIPHLADVAR